jgi:ABC-2 type transport system permease protein
VDRVISSNLERLVALVLLRWRMDLRGFRRGPERGLGLLVMLPGLLIMAVLVASLVYLGVSTLVRSSPHQVLPVLSLAASALGLLWVLSPLMTGLVLTEAHDLSRLLHFPVSPGLLVVASLVANLAQPMVLAEVPTLLLASAALSQGIGEMVLALIGLALALAFTLAAAHLAGVVLHGLSRNRRLHDRFLFISIGLASLLGLLPFLIFSGTLRLGGLVSRLVAADVGRVVPFSWGVRAAIHAGQGELVPFLGWAALQAGALVATVAVAAALSHRLYRGELDLGRSRGDDAAARGRMLLPGSVGALLEKDVRVLWRDPALKASLLAGFVGPVLYLILMRQMGGMMGSGGGLLILASVIGISASSANAFGSERRGLALLFGFPIPRWRVLVAKNVLALLMRLPGLLTLVLIGPLLAPISHLPAALVIAVVTALLAAGAENYVSILFPTPVPPPGGNPYGGAVSGPRGLLAVLVGMALFMSALMLSTPFVLLAGLPLWLGNTAWWWASLPLALAGGVSVYALLVGGAEAVLNRREPELLERVLGES